MSSLSLDGSTTFIGTEFLKLEITGTSNLATEGYVNTQVAQGGGSGYTDGEIDILLDGKVDLTNLNQTINGKIDISANPIPLSLKDATDGHKMRFTHGKHIDVFTEPETVTPVTLYLNYFNQGNVRVGDTSCSLSINNDNPNSKTFSCNGDAEFLQSITVTSTLQSTSIRTNTINTIGDVDLNFQQNSISFMHFDATADKIELDVALNSTSDIASAILKGETLSNYNANGLNLDTTTNSIYIKNNTATKIEVQSDKIIVSDPLHCNLINSNGANDITFQRNSVEYCKLREDGTVRLLEFPTNGGVSANRLYGNYFMNRSYLFDTIFEGSNTAGNARVEYMRYDFTNEVLQLPKKVLVNGGDGKTEIYESTEATNNVFRIWNKETTNTPVIHIGAGATSNDMVLSTGGFTFNKSVDCNVGLSVGENLTLTYNKKIVWGVNSIVETSSPTVPITRFDAPNTGSAYWFFVGPAVNDAYRIFTISNTEVLSKRVFKCNNIDTENNTDLVFKRNTVEFMKFNIVDSASRVDIPIRLALSGGLNQSVIYEADEVTQNALRIWNKDTTHANSNVAIGVGAEPNVMFFRSGFAQCKDEFRVNKINTTGNVNFYLQQNGTNMLTYDKDDATYPSGIFKFDTDVSVRTDKFIQCNTLRAHIFDSHPTLQIGDNDISFRYAGVTYMFYDKSLSNLQMRTDIVSDSNIQCVNLTETSDERVKENIKPITTKCSNIVKKVKVRKYALKNDEKKITNIGFVAQEVKQNIPKEFQNIVYENNEYMSLNYGKMAALLWKCVQEQMLRIDQLEVEIKELKGKNKI